MKSLAKFFTCILMILAISCQSEKVEMIPDNEIDTLIPPGDGFFPYARGIIKPDNIIEEMDNLKGWRKVYGSFLELNTDQVHSGKGSLKITSEGSGASSQIEKDVKWNLSDCSGKSMKIWVYPESDPETTISSVQIYCYMNESANDYFVATFDWSYLSENMWTLLWNPKWTVGAGSPEWKNIKRLRIKVNAKPGQKTAVSFDRLSAGEVRKNTILITFDDSFEGQYKLAYPLLKARNMVATTYVIMSNIDQENFLTAAELIELDANGWAVGNHSKNHSHLSKLTSAQMEDELLSCKNFLDKLGLTKASDHVSYPYGDFSDQLGEVMTSAGLKTGRLANGITYALYEQGYYMLGFPFRINCVGITYSTSLEKAKEYVDNVLELNRPGIFLFHDIVKTKTKADEWSAEDFSSLMEYIGSKEIQTLTIEEYYRLASGPLTVNHK